MTELKRPLAVITGASSGIGYELAEMAADRGHDLVIAADRPDIHQAAKRLEGHGVAVHVVEADLATIDGVDKLVATVRGTGQQVEALMANAGHGLGHGFLDQKIEDWRHVIDTNVTGTLYLIHCLARDMREQGSGHILITGSIAGFMPGSFQAVYNGTKAFINSFSFALREELKESGVTVTCLMPGATDTHFFERADMLDTAVGQAAKDSPRDVAEAGYEAMLSGEGDIVAGWKNKVQTAIASITPSSMLAKQHRAMAEPNADRR